MRWRTISALLAVMAGLTSGCGTVATVPAPTHQGAAVVHTPVTVMTLGGSVARGWKDTGWQAYTKGWYGGYLVRAVDALAKRSHIRYEIVNHTIVGANSSQMETLYKGDYEKWLRADRPNVVMISWGLLNDALPKTPMAAFRAHLQEEITEALAQHAVVWIVTPPVTAAAETQFAKTFPAYVKAELSVAHSFAGRNVYAFDLYDQMRADLASQHINVNSLMANSWHPNAKGHALAGRLLADALYRTFGDSAVRFRT